MCPGVGQGKNYAINFPLADGINDESYRSIFRPVIEKVLALLLPNKNVRSEVG